MNGNGTVMPIHAVDAHALPHRKLSKTERAILGAEILDGRVVLQGLTLKLIATAVGVSTSYIAAARRATPDQRRAIRHGLRPLVQPQNKPKALPAPVAPQEKLAAIVAEVGGVDAALDLLAAAELA
jgi:hypothetical protein